mgnify:CR=1 FL=1
MKIKPECRSKIDEIENHENQKSKIKKQESQKLKSKKVKKSSAECVGDERENCEWIDGCRIMGEFEWPAGKYSL